MREDDMSDMGAAAAAPKSKAVPVMLMLIVALIAGLWFAMQKKSASGGAPAFTESKESGSRGAEGSGLGPTLHLESFVVPLKTSTVERFANVTIDLEMSSTEERDAVGHSMPLIRDTVITFLIDQTVDDLRGSEGIAHLKEEVLGRVRKVLPGRRISNVYVTDFIVQ